MKIVIQRVTSASVSVGGTCVSSIGRGLLVFVGIKTGDTAFDAQYLSNKLLNVRIFDSISGNGDSSNNTNSSSNKTWSESVLSKNYDLLLVSQFTLYSVLKGNKPDFHCAMTPNDAKPFYSHFVQTVNSMYKQLSPKGSTTDNKVQEGIFGADMAVSLVNDGPVTITIDSDSQDFTREIEKANKAKHKFGHKKQQNEKGNNKDKNTAEEKDKNNENGNTSQNAIESTESKSDSSDTTNSTN